MGLIKGVAVFSLACLTLVWLPAPLSEYSADICIYGATSAGVTAAVAAAREGRTVVLVEPTLFVGGMSASGIGLVDRGDISTVGGIAREFYERAGAYYGKEIAWRIEPSVATRVFESMLAAHPGITVVRGARLESIDIEDRVIRSLAFDKGTAVTADVFIDATYEGDLMARAGVRYVTGREGSREYNESLAGVRLESKKHQFDLSISPFVRKDDPSSGLLPGISPEPMGVAGEADVSPPAYTYRLCLTKRPDRMPIRKPDDYDPLRYELLARFVVARKAAGIESDLRDLVQLDALPNGKFDLNNNGPLSTDYIGGSLGYAEAWPSKRSAVEAAHRSYIEGLFVFLRSDLRLPTALRRQAKQFGLARDEFVATSNWPPLLYVREARRMLGEYVVTQADSLRSEPAPNAVALASYMIDSHNCRRLAVRGRVANEGDVQAQLANPMAIPYEAILPRASECLNLLVPVCLSASHIAYSSVRMEPVFMMLGHASGVAASLAVEGEGAVHAINRKRLTTKLLTGGQVLSPKTPRR